MKKTLLVTAIAGALGVSAGASAATIYNQDGTKLDLYGNLQLAYKSIKEATRYEDANGVKNTQGIGALDQTESKDELFDNGSTIGVTGEHAIYDGLTGYFKAEWEFDADESKGSAGGIDYGDQTYLGLKGNFGDARLGSWDPLMDDWIQDPITNNEYFDVSDSSSAAISGSTNDPSKREGNKFQYMTPSWSGLQFALGTQYEGDAEDENLNDSSNASVFGGVKYEVGNFSIAGVYDNLDNFDLDVGDGTSQELGNQYGITGQYTWDTLRVALKVERFDSDNDNLESTNLYALGARYGYGNGMGDVYGAYQYVDVGGADFGDTLEDAVTSGDFPNDRDDESYNQIVLGATYNVSDAMYTFVEGAFYDREQHEDDGVAVGAVYLF